MLFNILWKVLQILIPCSFTTATVLIILYSDEKDSYLWIYNTVAGIVMIIISIIFLLEIDEIIEISRQTNRLCEICNINYSTYLLLTISSICMISAGIIYYTLSKPNFNEISVIYAIILIASYFIIFIINMFIFFINICNFERDCEIIYLNTPMPPIRYKEDYINYGSYV